MPTSRRLLVIAACLAFATGCFAQASKEKDAPPKLATQGKTPEIGEVILDYSFQNMMWGDGRTSMASLRGSVVLVDWWGIH